MIDTDIQPLVEQLNSKASAKRRSAAKKLRKLKAKDAGPPLLEALQIELKDKRTWETQYQMIMALGESGYTDSLEFLLQLAKQEFEATMIYIAIGDAITTLEQLHDPDLKSLSKWIDQDKKSLIEGAIRSLAINKTTPSNKLIKKIISYAEKPDSRNSVFWISAASPGWPENLTESFLKDCLEHSEIDDKKKTAKAALKGKYLNWNPL
ncbi:TPA: HEAT repeat domain-containing protein [Vibrio vulnificus]|nr:HEAT repeat domain-containing protein [Vibrio vulnificus]